MTDAVVTGLLDTSVVIDLDHLAAEQLPHIVTISAVTLGELSGGIHATDDPVERAVRVARLQRAELQFESLPFDDVAAQHYGTLVAHVVKAGRNPRPRRLDLMIAATAVSHELPLYTRNPRDFAGLEQALTTVPV